MTKRPVLQRKRGATLTVVWQIDEDTESLITVDTPIRSVLKKISTEQSRIPNNDSAEDAIMDVTYGPAVGEAKGYIHCELTPAQSEALCEGFYVTDVWMDLAGITPVVPAATVQIMNTVTGDGA